MSTQVAEQKLPIEKEYFDPTRLLTDGVVKTREPASPLAELLDKPKVTVPIAAVQKMDMLTRWAEEDAKRAQGKLIYALEQARREAERPIVRVRCKECRRWGCAVCPEYIKMSAAESASIKDGDEF